MMRNIFKRRRPTPAPVPATISRADVLVALHWGYTPAQWASLPSIVQVDKREGYAQAVGLA